MGSAVTQNSATMSVHNLSSRLRTRAMRWSQLLFEFSLNQGLAQGLGMIAGFIYVRLMPVGEYALYALSLSTLAFVSIGSDVGLTASLTYFWRESGKGRTALEAKIAAIRKLRMVLLGFAILVSAGMFYKTLTRQPLPTSSAIACFLIVVGTAWLQVQTTVELQLIRLEGRQRQSYYCEAAGSVTRFIAAVGMLVTGISTAWFGLAGGLLGSLAVLIGIILMVPGPWTAQQSVDSRSWAEVRSYILPVLPGVLVYMLQEPLILWLAATFGGVAPVSGAFAVGRIGAVFAFIGQFLLVVVAPRLASVKDDAHFVKLVAIVAAGLVGFGSVAISLSYFSPWIFLLLIGPKYAHLDLEVQIVTATASINVLAMLVVLTNRVRGWVRLDPVVASCQVVAIFILAVHWSFQSAKSVLGASLLLACINLLFFLAVLIIGILKPKLVATSK
jgi:O-antigen/teichoic acid export membrane protein